MADETVHVAHEDISHVQQEVEIESDNDNSFESFGKLEARVEKFENSHFVKFWKRDTRKVEAARKRMNKSIKPELKYYEKVLLHPRRAAFQIARQRA